jgi:SAM-dependent methyltransferase
VTARTPVDWTELGRGSDPCIVCGSADAAPLYPPTFHASLAEAPDYFLAHRRATAHGPIVKCRGCGFVFTSPRFAPEDYDRIYGSIATPHEGVVAFDAAKGARFQRLAALVRPQLGDDAALLDFGCGDGAFLRELDNSAAKGFEIGAPGRIRAGSSEVILGDWASSVGTDDLPTGGFDVVTAFDVLEHLPRIEEDVAYIRALLRPGGLLFASVPNSQSIVARVMGKRWNMILLEHLWYFSPRTLDAFLARHGFTRVAMQSLPFDAPLAHVATRLAQTFGMNGAFVPRGAAKWVLPVPAGILLGIYRAV